MTEKLYQIDAYLQECDGCVLERSFIDGLPAVCLDRTIFYPTSGGQMHDTGWLNEVEVTDVRVVDEKIWHLLSAPLSKDQVHAKLNWERRFDFMQQHTAFHILAGCFLRLFKIETLSSHLGEMFSTIEVNVGDLEPEKILQVENSANRIIWENRPVHIHIVSAEQARAWPVRKEAVVSGRVRLVEITDHDLDPCGGTHVSSTAQVGMVKIMARERVHKHLRFSFVAGKRALMLFQSYHRLLQDLTHLLATGMEDLPRTIGELINKQKELLKKVRDQAESIAERRLQEIGERAKRERIVDVIFSELDMTTLRRLASAALKQQPGIYLLAATGERAFVIFATSDARMDLRPFFHDVLAQIDGKGGGEANFLQGSGTKVEALPQAIASAKAAVLQTIQSDLSLARAAFTSGG